MTFFRYLILTLAARLPRDGMTIKALRMPRYPPKLNKNVNQPEVGGTTWPILFNYTTPQAKPHKQVARVQLQKATLLNS